MVVSVLALWEVGASYYSNFADYPWTLLLATLIVCFLGALLSRQWIAAGVVILLPLVVLVPGLLPPSTPVPASISPDGLTVTWRPTKVSGDTFTGLFMIRGAAGENLRKRYDVKRVRAEARALTLGVENWSAYETPPPYFTDLRRPVNEAHFYERIFAPKWFASYYVKVFVPEWPAQPAETMSITLAPRGKLGATVTGGQHLKVAGVWWRNSEQFDPPEMVLHCAYELKGLEQGFGLHWDLLAVDDFGEPLIAASVSDGLEIEVKNPQARVVQLRLYRIDKNVKEHVFDFGLVPNGRTGMG